MSIQDNLYDYDKNYNTYLIKLAPKKYLDIFNNLDHYPIKKRDINQDVINYIEDCSNDIPLNFNLKIEILIRNEEKNCDLEERTRKGINNYFLYSMDFYKNLSKQNIQKSIIYALVFLFFTVVTLYLQSLKLDMNKILLKTIFEGMTIGSWVFLWEAIVTFFIKNRQNHFMIKTYTRLISSEITFNYS
ncbi:MAG: hypothetical protein JXR48_03725 [Candidatus Delongbacteria bacterium]|nr:hypothetical protein [Candidatus Delongbacteria bacterium]MBN2834055.1 hypothetical protein [Candidatus Delongbacteria bacterium]